jgi:hypothetical protein
MGQDLWITFLGREWTWFLEFWRSNKPSTSSPQLSAKIPSSAFPSTFSNTYMPASIIVLKGVADPCEVDIVQYIQTTTITYVGVSRENKLRTSASPPVPILLLSICNAIHIVDNGLEG